MLLVNSLLERYATMGGPALRASLRVSVFLLLLFLVLVVGGCASEASTSTLAADQLGTMSSSGSIVVGGDAGETTPSASLGPDIPAALSPDSPSSPPDSVSPDSPSSPPDTVPLPSPSTTVFAVIGDYGMDDENEAAVAALVASWRPAYVITTGDDYYTPAGGKGTAKYDESTGAYYGAWLKDITTTGRRCPQGLAHINAFFPSLGNHDYSSAGIRVYLEYFHLPGRGFSNSSGNERYYDFVQGPVHFFVLDSNKQQPHGTSSTSRQAQWLRAQLAASTSTWNVVYGHHPPYSSDLFHGSMPYIQWPFAKWGADVVLAGHAHAYERIERDGIVYFVNGLGGAARYLFGLPVEGSRVRYNAGWGAQKVIVTKDAMVFEFWSTRGELIDSYTLPAGG